MDTWIYGVGENKTSGLSDGYLDIWCGRKQDPDCLHLSSHICTKVSPLLPLTKNVLTVKSDDNEEMLISVFILFILHF